MQIDSTQWNWVNKCIISSELSTLSKSRKCTYWTVRYNKYNTEPQPKTQGYMGGLLHTERNTHSEHPLVTNWVSLSLFHTAGSVYRHSSSFSSLKFIQCAEKLQADLLVCSVASGRLFIARRMSLCYILSSLSVLHSYDLKTTNFSML